MQLAKIHNGKVVLQAETLKKLKKLGKGIKVVALFGGARSAKSTTANMLLGKNVFQNSNTTDACTFGVWVDTAVQEDGSVLMVVDSEGMGKGDTSQHPKILSLVSLLASDGGALVDNEMKDFVEHHLGTLGVLATMNQILRGAQEHNWPALFVLVRDFTLKLTVARRPAASPTHYLNHVLESPRDQEDSTRKLIKECFVIRHMFTLPPPTEQELMSMLNLPPGPFKEAFNSFKTTLLDSLLFKKISTVDCDGPMLVEFLNYFVESLNKGEGVDIPNAHEVVVERHCGGIRDQLLAKYTEEIPKENLTGDMGQLKEQHTKVLKELLEKYEELTSGLESPHVEKVKNDLVTQIGTAYALLEAENKVIMERLKNEEMKKQQEEQQLQQNQFVEAPLIDRPMTRTDLSLRKDTAAKINQLHDEVSFLRQQMGQTPLIHSQSPPPIYGQQAGFPFQGAQYSPQQPPQPNIVMVTVNNTTPTSPPSSPQPTTPPESNGNNNNNTLSPQSLSVQQSIKKFDNAMAARSRSPSPNRGTKAMQASDVLKFDGHRVGRK